MPTIIRAPQAKSDLVEIAVYIAQDNPSAAFRLLDVFDEKFEMLARQPLIGEARDDLANELREFPVGNYVIYYQPIDDGIRIARVLHGARDIDSLF